MTEQELKNYLIDIGAMSIESQNEDSDPFVGLHLSQLLEIKERIEKECKNK